MEPLMLGLPKSITLMVTHQIECFIRAITYFKPFYINLYRKQTDFVGPFSSTDQRTDEDQPCSRPSPGKCDECTWKLFIP
jgi:hypothetical protein